MFSVSTVSTAIRGGLAEERSVSTWAAFRRSSEAEQIGQFTLSDVDHVAINQEAAPILWVSCTTSWRSARSIASL